MGSNDDRRSWIPVAADEGAALRHQAAATITPGHPLHGLTIEADARCSGCESVAFRVEDGTFAIVHLSGDGDTGEPPRPPTVRCETRIDYELALDAHRH